MPFNFVPAVGSPFAVGAQPSGLAWGYLDPDSYVDLVTSNMGSDNYSVLRNLGNGTFAAVINYPLKPGFAPSDAAVADCNNDNVPDVLIAGGGTNEFSLSYGVGDGTFLAPIYTIADWFPSSFVVKDFNGDGFNDVYLTTMGGVTALNGTATGFGAPITYPAIANSTSIITGDFFNNGQMGVAVAGPVTHEIETFPGTGGGLGAGVVTSLGPSGSSVPQSIATADLNGDGNLDLVATFVNFRILYGYGNGSYVSSMYALPGTSIELADADLDGFLDLIIGDRPAKSVYVSAGNSIGTFGTASGFTVGIGNEPTAYAVDVNGDGLPDIVTTNYADNTTSVLINESIPPLSQTPTPTLTQSLTTSSSVTLSPSSTISNSLSLSTTVSETMSSSATSTQTPSTSSTHTLSQSITLSQTMSATNSYTSTVNPSNLTSVSMTSTGSESASLSATMSKSVASNTVSNSASLSLSHQPTESSSSSPSKSENKTNSNKAPTKKHTSPKDSTHTPQKTDKANIPSLDFDTNTERQVSVFDTTDCHDELGHAEANMPDTHEYAVSAPGTEADAGAVYIISDQIELRDLFYAEDLPSQDKRIDGANPGDRLGSTLKAYDVNGDGLDDLIIAAENAYQKRGAVYILYSPIKKSMNVNDLKSEEGEIFIGEEPGDSLGLAVAGLKNPFDPSESYLAISSKQKVYVLRSGHYPLPTKIDELNSKDIFSIQLKNSTDKSKFGSALCYGGDFMGDFTSQNRSSLVVGDRGNSVVRVLELPLNDTQASSYYAEDLTLMTIATKNRHDELGTSITLVKHPTNQYDALSLGAPGSAHGDGKAYFVEGSDSFPEKLVLTQGNFQGTIIHGLPCARTGFSTGVTQQGDREVLLFGSPWCSTSDGYQVGCVSLLMVDVLVGESPDCTGNLGSPLEDVYLNNLDKKAGFNVVYTKQGARYGTSVDSLQSDSGFIAGAPGCQSDITPCKNDTQPSRNDASSNSLSYSVDIGANVVLAAVAGKLAVKAVNWMWGLFSASKQPQETKTLVSPAEFQHVKNEYQRLIDFLKQDAETNKWLLFHLEDDLDEMKEYTPDNVTPEFLKEWQEELTVYRQDFLSEYVNNRIERLHKAAESTGMSARNIHSFYETGMTNSSSLVLKACERLQINLR